MCSFEEDTAPRILSDQDMPRQIDSQWAEVTIGRRRADVQEASKAARGKGARNGVERDGRGRAPWRRATKNRAADRAATKEANSVSLVSLGGS